MATFRCVRSGNLMKVLDEGDLIKMRSLESYKEIFDEKENSQKANENANEKREVLTVKRMGRPARVLN